MNFWIVIYRFAWGVVLALIVMLAIGLFAPKCRQLRQLQGDKNALEAENKRLNDEINDLHDRQLRFTTDPAFVERVASEGGMVRSNQTLIKFEPVTTTEEPPMPQKPKKRK